MANPITLSIDVGATHVKAQALGSRGRALDEPWKVKTPRRLSPTGLLELLVDLAQRHAPFDRVSVGLPGLVRRGIVYALPLLGDRRLHSYPLGDLLTKRLERPVRIANDAEMHALGVVRRRGVEIVLTLGTGLGSAMFLDGMLGPRIAIMTPTGGRGPIGGAYGDAARAEIGNARWSKRVHSLIDELRGITNFDHCYIGGGNAKVVRGRLPRGVCRIDNTAAALGGVRLWDWAVET
jgi:polyphosphate glucokinase